MLTLDQAADWLKIPRATLRTWQRRGQITSACDVRTRKIMIDAVSVKKRVELWDKRHAA